MIISSCYSCLSYSDRGMLTHNRFLCVDCFYEWKKYLNKNKPKYDEAELYGGIEETFNEFISSVRMLKELSK